MLDKNTKTVINSMTKKLQTSKAVLYTMLIVLALIIVLVRMGFKAYETDKSTIISQQQQHLLTISKSICQGLEVFVSEKMDGLKILTLNEEFAYGVKSGDITSIQSALNAFVEAQNHDIQMIYEIDSSGEIIYQYPNKAINSEIELLMKDDIERVLKNKTQYISRARKDSNGEFTVNLFMPVFFEEEFAGIIAASVKLESMYEKLVRNAKGGEKGYAMVKDQDRIILMHPVKEKVGIASIETRKELYPYLDLSELEDLIDQQLTNEEGTSVYHSYWWTENVLKKAKKLNAFARAYIGEYFWVVSTTMSYDEVEGPLRKSLEKIIEISALVVIILTMEMFIILKMQKNKEALEVETKYLKELNKTTEELRKSEVQLQHSQKLQTIGTLTGGIAHEFNNLLTPILGYSELLLNDCKDEEMYDEISEIYDSSKKAKDIIEQILIFSHRNNTTIKLKPVKINELVNETLKLVKLTIPNNINIVHTSKEDCGYILANPTQIHQVLINLCTNAIYAMKESGGLLEIDMRVVSKNQEKDLKNRDLMNETFVKITVKDTGCGMSKEMMNKIFDPFHTTKPVGEGTGLGLSVVHGIIERHRGKVVVKSVEGVGSTFNVYLPRIELKTNYEKLVGDDYDEGKESILIVDDDHKIVKVMKKSLEKFGYKVSTETNSLKALKNICINPYEFDLIITDQNMPELEGIELAKKLKELRPDLKIILITGFINDNVAGYINSTVIDDYLVKPILSAELHNKIQKVLLSDDLKKG
ncbi:MAG: response regulator [Clostridia bacterium]|nr:response regulator [Clostridia bacterium]